MRAYRSALRSAHACPLMAGRSCPGLIYSSWQIPLEETSNSASYSPAQLFSLLVIAGAGPAAAVQLSGGELACTFEDMEGKQPTK